MCGRFNLLLTWREIHDLLENFVLSIKPNPEIQIEKAPPRYNVAPTQPILVLKRAGGMVEPELMRWGLVPEWVEDPSDFPLIINARAETLAEKASFKNALKNRRCIVPASGYYEWQKDDQGNKTPIYITRKDGMPFLMAGLHSTWVGPDGEEVDTAAIITVPAGEDMKSIHTRTPAMLQGDAIEQWLDTAQVNAANAHKLIKSLPEGVVRFHPVTKRVNSARNDDPDLIVPVYEEKLAEPKTEGKDAKPAKKAASGQLDLF